jgi:hypothetical protein
MDYDVEIDLNEPEWYSEEDERDNTVAEYVDAGHELQIREDEEVTSAWIRSDLTGEDILYIRGGQDGE